MRTRLSPDRAALFLQHSKRKWSFFERIGRRRFVALTTAGCFVLSGLLPLAFAPQGLSTAAIALLVAIHAVSCFLVGNGVWFFFECAHFDLTRIGSEAWRETRRRTLICFMLLPVALLLLADCLDGASRIGAMALLLAILVAASRFLLQAMRPPR